LGSDGEVSDRKCRSERPYPRVIYLKIRGDLYLYVEARVIQYTDPNELFQPGLVASSSCPLEQTGYEDSSDRRGSCYQADT
jgi:hypothetical protein